MLNLIREVQFDLFGPAVGIAGVYGYEVGPDLAAGQVRQQCTFNNLITDVGLEALGGTASLSTLTGYFAVGTGSAPPAVGDTGLQSQVGTRINSTGGFSVGYGYNASTDPANPFHWRRIPRVWAKGAFGGDVNLTELGVFSAATGGVCWSRQLFRDSGGLPTTVPVKADEELKIWYEYRLYPPMTDTVQTITVKGASVTVTNRAVNINDTGSWGGYNINPPNLLDRFGGWSGSALFAFGETPLPARTSNIGGSPTGRSSEVLAPYVGGSRQRGSTGTWDPSAANFTGGKVGGIAYSPTGSSPGSRAPFISHFATSVIKTTEEYMTANVTCAWARTPNPTI